MIKGEGRVEKEQRMKKTIERHFQNNHEEFYRKYLAQVKKIGGQEFQALCRFHEDTKPSFNFNNEKGIYFCHACGEQGNIFTFYARINKIDPGVEFPKVLKGIASDFSIPWEERGRRLAKTYDYTDQAGNLIFQTCRYEPKGFSQRRPNGNGGWTWNLRGIKRVLYRLPEVVKAQEVFIPEGEKDCDNLSTLGFVATTNPGGAGHWRDDFNESLRGKDVVLIPHNDPAGHEHAVRIASSLSGIAKSIKRLDLPGLPPKGDVSIWIVSFQDPREAVDHLRIMVQSAEIYTPPKLHINNDKPSDENGNESLTTIQVQTNLTDLGNARRFVQAHGRDLHYCYPWKKWLCWNGQRWEVDRTGEVNRRAKDTVMKIYEEASREGDDRHRQALAKHALGSESEKKMEAMVKLAQSEPGIPALPEQMDQELSFLNLMNGTLNLDTGELLPHQREQLITKMAPVEFDLNAQCPLWTTHLNKIFLDKPEMISFLQLAFGYSMTGIFSDKILLMSYGTGDNGKTVTHETFAGVLGDYAMKTPIETLLARDKGSIPNDIARLKGARYVFSVEPEEGKRLRESLVKELTGGDTISARFLHQEFFDYKATFKIWIATNHKPVIKGTDNAIWRRIRLIPFNCSIPECEQVPMNEFLERLKAEWPGILLWGLQGYQEWKKWGLAIPDEIKEATKTYREEMDVLADFLNECCEVKKTAETPAGEIYGAYSRWCGDAGERPMSQKSLGQKLQEKGFQKDRTGKKRLWKGIGLIGKISNDAGAKGPSDERSEAAFL